MEEKSESEISAKWHEMLSRADAVARRKHPRVCRLRNRSLSHSFAYIECVGRIGRELYPDFDGVRMAYLNQRFPELLTTKQG